MYYYLDYREILFLDIQTGHGSGQNTWIRDPSYKYLKSLFPFFPKFLHYYIILL